MSLVIKNLIFDFDGTLGNSVSANWHAVNHCLRLLGYKPVTKEKIRRHLGEPVNEYYQHLLGKRHAHAWKHLRACSELHVPMFFHTYLKLFPGVRTTLTALRDRGYRLILYSNAPPYYFGAVLASTGLKHYFHATMPMHPRATKISTVRRLRKKYPGKTVIIGDRDHDMAAAQANKCLAIHCGYGFQKKTTIKPDARVKHFAELLCIFR